MALHAGRHGTVSAFPTTARIGERNLKGKAPVDRLGPSDGFSFVEAGIVLLMVFVVAGFALLNIGGIMPGIRANTALKQVMAQLRTGRELALAQRRNIEVRFVGDNQIELVRFDVPSGRTSLGTVTLEGDFEFRVFDEVPDTPDAFGKSSAIDFGGAGTLIFLSDGTLADDAGEPVNGTVFLGLADRPETARAVTILGATGRVRGYRWTGTAWIQ